MSSNRSRRRNRRDKKRARPSNGPSPAQTQGYEDIVKENDEFETYYKAQKIVKEEEWNDFMSTMRESLPVTFRITGCKSNAKALLKIIQNDYLNHLLKTDDTQIKKPFCLPWYPDGLAWQINISRKEIRKSETLKKLHDFLIHETDGGYISRQEAVSMIPPLVLDVQPHHKVFDMCAAPGSKTSQLIEMLHANEELIPEGILVANDIDNKRCYMLVHQAKRLHSPCFIITNHDSAKMPNILVKQNDRESHVLKFDRIVCDVPCSGDGTLRKNYDVWRKWNTANGNNFHGLQSRIARRGLELLEVGGLMVYSTCSLNPMEDEAVIHNLLTSCEGSVELQDVSMKLQGLKYSCGLNDWVVMSRDMTSYKNYDEVPSKFMTQIRPQMFPPKPEDAGKFHLERCLRILPHYQNTGGFFVAVLKKVSHLPWERKIEVDPNSSMADPVENDSQAEVDKTSTSSPPRKKPRMHGHREDPFYFFTEDEQIWPDINNFYKINDSFDHTCLLTRCNTGKKRHVYLTSKAVRNIVIENSGKLKIINTGIKVFCRNDNRISRCNYRLTQEGIECMFSFIEDRKVCVNRNDMIALLTTEHAFGQLSPDARSQLRELDSGCVILRLHQPLCDLHLGIDDQQMLLFLVCGWKGATSVRAFIPKSEQVHYLRMIGVDPSQIERRRPKVDKTGKTENTGQAVDAIELADDNTDGNEAPQVVTDIPENAS